MRKTLLLGFATLTALLFSTGASALVIEVAQNGSKPAQFNVTSETQLVFTETDFSVNNGKQSDKFNYSDVVTITFAEGSASIAAPAAGATIYTLASNPVDETLLVNGFNGDESVALNLTSLSGTNVLSVPDWKGQALNVSTLPSGLYILTIDSQTLKVLKK